MRDNGNGNYSYNGFRVYRGPGLTGVPGKRSSPLGIVEAHPEKNLAEGIFTAALACGRLSSLTSSGHRTTDDGQGSRVHGLGFVIRDMGLRVYHQSRNGNMSEGLRCEV